ncbi:MAG TPA: hypothetical protein VEY11_10505 [Pyrinomonadaceae bacterium]|nr:hypothetical protein [Pyrinomonadaceae bacterium]
MSLTIRLLMAGFLAMSASLFARTTQEKERSITKESWRTEPVKIKVIKVKGKPVGFNQKFAEGDDWLKGITINVENISKKPILYIRVEILFRRPQGVKNSEQTPNYLHPLFYGEIPPPGELTHSDGRKQLMPGESVDLALPENEHLSIKTTLEYLGYPAELTKVTLAIGDVVFDDGTKWSGDFILHRDPNNPNKWNVVENLSKPAPDSDKRQEDVPVPGLSFVPANFRLKKL